MLARSSRRMWRSAPGIGRRYDSISVDTSKPAGALNVPTTRRRGSGASGRSIVAASDGVTVSRRRAPQPEQHLRAGRRVGGPRACVLERDGQQLAVERGRLHPVQHHRVTHAGQHRREEPHHRCHGRRTPFDRRVAVEPRAVLGAPFVDGAARVVNQQRVAPRQLLVHGHALAPGVDDRQVVHGRNVGQRERPVGRGGRALSARHHRSIRQPRARPAIDDAAADRAARRRHCACCPPAPPCRHAAAAQTATSVTPSQPPTAENSTTSARARASALDHGLAHLINPSSFAARQTETETRTRTRTRTRTGRRSMR